MRNKEQNIPSMAQIAQDAENLSHFNDHTFRGIVEDQDQFDDEYDGFDDDDLSFDGRSKSFADQHMGQRLLALTIDNTANATDVNVGLFASFAAAYAACGEGATVSIEGTAIVVHSNGTTKLVTLQKYAYRNPIKVVGMRVNFTRAEQAGKTISFAYNDPFKSKKETIVQPESYRSERNNQDKIITIPIAYTLGDQTDLIVQVAALEKLSFFVMFGGIYNTSKSLSKKHDRAAVNLQPAAVAGK